MRRKVPAAQVTSLRGVETNNGQALDPAVVETEHVVASWLFGSRRQRNRGVRERMQIGDHVGALALLRNTGKAHRGPGHESLRAGQELVEVLIGPGAALALHAGGEVEAAALALVVADDAPEIRTDPVRLALRKGVAGLALLGRRLALLHRGGREQLLD